MYQVRVAALSLTLALVGAFGVVGLYGCGQKQQPDPETVVPSAQVELAVPDAEATHNEDDALSQDADPGHAIGSQIVKPEPVAPDANLQIACVMYWVDASGNVEKVQDKIADIKSAPQAALEKLLAGVNDAEKQKGFHSAIPAGTTLKSVTMDDTVCVVDLSQEFTQSASEAEIRARIAQVVLTASQFNEVEAVKITVNSKAPNMGHDINLASPQMPDLWR